MLSLKKPKKNKREKCKEMWDEDKEIKASTNCCLQSVSKFQRPETSSNYVFVCVYIFLNSLMASGGLQAFIFTTRTSTLDFQIRDVMCTLTQRHISLNFNVDLTAFVSVFRPNGLITTCISQVVIFK